MKLRPAPLLAAAALLAGGAVFVSRRGGGPAAPASPPPRAAVPTLSSPAAPPPGAAAPTPSASPDKPPASLRLFSSARSSLTVRVGALLEREGPRAAFAALLRDLETDPSDLGGRVRRAYVLRFLPWLAMKDPSLEPDVLRVLERHAGVDADPYARFVAVATLFDRSAFFSETRPERGFFFARVAQRLTPELAGLDRGVLDLPRRDFPRLHGLAEELFARERDASVRQLWIELIADEKNAGTAGFLARAAEGDADADVRFCAIEGLAASGPSPATRDALLRAADDASPRNRLAALNGLVRLGAVDDWLVARLLSAPERSAEGYQTIGEAYASSGSPALAARLRASLASPERATRAMALHGLLSTRRAEFVADLERARERETDAELRRSMDLAVRALKGELPSPSEDDDP